VYYRNQNLNEARQTLDHAIRLRRKDDALDAENAATDLELAHAYYVLAQVHETAGDLTKAVIQLRRALKIEQNSPRYLDRLIEVSILKKDKIGALDALDRLRSANPENQKLDSFKERIAEL
jgi:tetratricopeptide (TPR) repeat protein